jgi:hypothetical protein
MDVVRSKNNVSIRLPEARWFHITEEHSEMDKYLVVVYREVSKTDGFVITAFLTKRKRQFERRHRLWPQ